MSVFAAPLGLRRPCSHCSNVRCETPSKEANSAWVRPALMRARAIGERGSTLTRLPPPRWISRAPSMTSCQISRLASNRARAFSASFLAIFERLLQLSQDMGRRILLPGLRIQGEHPKLIGPVADEVYDSQ